MTFGAPLKFADFLMLQVECHSGLAYADRPTALTLDGERLEVEAVEAEWRLPDGKRFRGRTKGGLTFTIFYDLRADAWRLEQE